MYIYLIVNDLKASSFEDRHGLSYKSISRLYFHNRIISVIRRQEAKVK